MVTVIKLLRFLAKLVVVLGIPMSAMAAESLLVFYPTLIPSAERQALLKGKIPGFDITVFDKYKDFELNMKINPEHVIVFHGADVPQDYKLIAKLKDLSGSGQTELKVFSLDPAMKLTEDTKLGMVTVTDRKEQKKFANDIVGVPVKAVKGVTKLEDLVPQLVLKNVDAILMSVANLEEVKGKFDTPLHEIGINKKVDPIRLLSRGGDSAKLKGALQALSGDDLKGLGLKGVE